MKKKTQQKDGEILFGIHPIIELLSAKKRKIYTLYTTKPEPKAWNQINRLMQKRSVNIQYTTREALSRLAGSSDHQGFVALVQPFPFLKQFFNPKKHKFLLLLDSIQDVGNVGAIMRSAYCTNCDGVIICKKGGAPLSAAALKASAGLAEHLNIYQAASVAQAVKDLKSSGYQLYLAALGGKDSRSVEYNMPLCLVIGNEATGITRSIMREGQHITLAQRTADISYNASVEAGILLFEIASSLHKI